MILYKYGYCIGRKIEVAAAGQFIGLGLELGGKDPAYIRADADLDYAIESTVDGAFFNSGQSCCGLERIYVHESVYDAYVAGFVALTKAINAPIQGTAADVIRRAMVRMPEAIAHLPAKMLLQVHDELLFEVEDCAVEALIDVAKQVMERASLPVVKLDVLILIVREKKLQRSKRHHSQSHYRYHP